MSEINISKTAWVSCPVCHEPHMRQETDAQGFGLIHCTNHFCRSNLPGDDKASSSLKESLDAAVAHLGGVTGLEKTSKGREVLAQIKRIFDPIPRHPAEWDDVKSAMLSADLHETRGSRAWCERFASAIKASHDADRTANAAPFVGDKPFALVRDRFFDGEISIAMLQIDGTYLFSDGDCHAREGNVLGMWEAEFLTHYEFEVHLMATQAKTHS